MADLRDRYISPLSTRYAVTRCRPCFPITSNSAPGGVCGLRWRRRSARWGSISRKSRSRELEAHRDDVNYEVAEAREREVRHDVMSHIYAYGRQCPKAEPIIHLGATSCYVGDNTDVIILREASRIILRKPRRS